MLLLMGLLGGIYLISDPVLLVNIATESAFTICSAIEAAENTMALVVWGEPGTLGTSFDQVWKAAERAAWVIDRVPPYLLGVIVGLILSDGNLHFTNCRAANARLQFQQSMIHFAYFYSVFWLCAPLCQSMFKFGTGLRKGTVYYFIRFHTRSLPFLTERPPPPRRTADKA